MKTEVIKIPLEPLIKYLNGVGDISDFHKDLWNKFIKYLSKEEFEQIKKYLEFGDINSSTEFEFSNTNVKIDINAFRVSQYIQDILYDAVITYRFDEEKRYSIDESSLNRLKELLRSLGKQFFITGGVEECLDILDKCTLIEE